MQCECVILLCYLRPIRLYHIFPTLSHKRHDFREKKGLLNTKCVFISVFNQIDAHNLFHNKFYFMPLHVSSTCAHHQEVKIVLYSLWYHQTYRWPSRTQRGPPIGVMIPEAV